MPTPLFRGLLAAGVLALALVARAAAPDPRGPHDMILVDEGNRQIHRVNLRDPARDWDASFDGKLVRDIQLIGGGRLLASVGQLGYVELDLATGKVLKTYKGYGSQTARRTPDGHTWLGAGNIIVELDAKDAEVRRITVPGAFIKVIRHTGADTLFLGAHDKMLEVDLTGKVIKTWVTGADDSYLATRLATGEVIIASGKARDVKLFSADGSLLRSIGPTSPDYARIGGQSWAGFQLLSNRDIIVTTWQGHGNQGDKGVQVAQFDWQGKLVWEWKQDPKRIASLHGILVLDGLDLDKLHDTRFGWLEPVR